MVPESSVPVPVPRSRLEFASMNARPAMISYQDNETRSLLFIRPDVIDRISSDGNTAIIHFSDGTTSLTAEKPSAIAARIKASEASGAGIDSPAHETGSPTLHEDKDRAPSPFQQVVDRNLTMTYCMVGPKQKAMLAIVRQKQGSFTSTYIQYRDNQTDCYPRLTISVEANGNAVAQILMQGDGPSFDRIKTIDLATLLALATNWNPPRNSAIPSPE